MRGLYATFAAANVVFLLSLGSGTAAAADLPREAPSAPSAAPAVPPAPVNWTGVYLGAGAGYGSLVGDSLVEILDYWEYYSAVDREAGYFTGVAGFDYQFLGPLVVGAFVEYDASNYTDPTLSQTSYGGRIGFLPHERVLVFASAGYSTMDIADQDMASLGYDLPVSGKVKLPTASGAFVGVGAEVMLTRSWSLRGEYRRTFFDKQNLELPDLYFFDLDSVATADFKPESNIFRFTLNYKIGLGD